ncbi:MAG: hypothetical protein IPJ55_16535 [Chloracidobacterium sp.]|nr:hypothetical protein [Chloracidobacterium sp.]MBL0239516.1 hypothetical protein [Chloracidobacterium sp.]
MPGDDSPVSILRAEPERINPAIILADRLMRRDVEELLTVEEVAEAENVLATGTQEIEAIESHRKAFLKTPASAIDYIPLGF